MNKAAPWSIKGVDFDAREAAMEAARRSGMSLGEWLNEVIAEQAAELGVAPADIDSDTRLEAVAAKLARMNRSAGRPATNPPRENMSPPALKTRPAAAREHDRPVDHDAGDLRRRPHNPLREGEPAAHRPAARPVLRSRRLDMDGRDENGGLEDYRAKNLREPEDLLDKAIFQFDERGRDAQKKTANALANVAQWIEASESRRENEREVMAKVTRKLDQIQNRVDTRDGDSEVMARGVLDKVVQRLETIENRVMDRADLEQTPVREALERLESRMEALAKHPATIPGVENSLRSLDSKIADLNQRLAGGTRPDQALGPESMRPKAVGEKAPLETAVADIMRRQRSLEQSPAASAASVNTSARTEKSEFDRRLEAVTARMEQALANAGAEREQGAHGVNQLRGDVSALAGQLEAMRHERLKESESATLRSAVPDPQISKLRQDIAEMSEALSDLAPRGSVDALESSMRELARRIEVSRNIGGPDALLAPVEKLAAELRNVVRELDPRQAVGALHREMQLINAKIGGREGNNLDAQSLARLQAQMLEIRELVTQAASRPLPVDAIERQIAALSERIDKSTRQNNSMGVVRAPQPDFSGITDNIREIVTRALPGATLQHLEEKLELLDEKINEALSNHGPEIRLAEMSRRMEDVQRTLETPQPTPSVDMRPFEEMMREISRKLEAPRPDAAAAPALKALESQIANIATKLDAGQHGLPVQALGQFDMLARSIDALQHRVGQQQALSAPDLANIDETLRGLARTLENVRKSDVSAPMLEAIEAQLALVTDRLEQANQSMWALSSSASTHFDTLSKRIDSVQANVSHQLATIQTAPAPVQSPDFGDLEKMVRGLAEKLEDAASANPSSDAFEHLEAQVMRLAGQLEKSNAHFATLGTLEQTVGDLFGQIEETRHAALDAAETAARTAARDTLREAMQSGSATGSPDLTREIASLKSLQEETDRRTHSTLSLVHNTLEKVVDRLNVLEQDIVDNADDERLSYATLGEQIPSRTMVVQEAQETARGQARNDTPVAKRSAAEAQLANLRALEEDNFLIEPGARRSGAEELRRASNQLSERPAPDLDPAANPGVKGDLQNIIAAARRLHQAQAEKAIAQMAMAPPNGKGQKAKNTGRTGLLGQMRTYLGTRKRPALLAAACVLLMLGTVGYIRVTGMAGQPVARSSEIETDGRRAQVSDADAGADATDAVADPAAKSRDSASTDAAPDKAASGDDKGASGLDRNPVGTIANPLPPYPGPPRIASAAIPPASGTLLQLATNGNAAAQYEMGLRAGDGRGMPRDMVTAAQWLEKAAAQNLAPALYRLGTLYEKGIGVGKDPAKALVFYQRAAVGGNVRAMHNYAVLLADGGIGKPDYGNATIWFTKAAEHGVRDSQFNLAVLYARGLTGQQDLVKSWVWFTLAANQGDADAASKLKDVAARLDSRQLEQAKAEIAAFKPKTGEPSANEVPAPPQGWDTTGLGAETAKPGLARPFGFTLPEKNPQRPKISGL